MVSKKRLWSELTSFSPDSKACNAPFLLSMKLCTSKLLESADDASCADNELYSTTKRCLFYAESEGYLSLRLVQSLVLLAVYDMGHAIYPAARLAMAIGLHNTKLATQLSVLADMWTLMEEPCRYAARLGTCSARIMLDDGMRQIIEGFKALRTEWRVRAEYLLLLDKEHGFEMLEGLE